MKLLLDLLISLSKSKLDQLENNLSIKHITISNYEKDLTRLGDYDLSIGSGKTVQEKASFHE